MTKEEFDKIASDTKAKDEKLAAQWEKNIFKEAQAMIETFSRINHGLDLLDIAASRHVASGEHEKSYEAIRLASNIKKKARKLIPRLFHFHFYD